ncbi:hypothetical protein [Flavitalea sp.]|nr:hypothetical protein [Flavitalea sp.]
MRRRLLTDFEPAIPDRVADLLWNTTLVKKISQYGFFDYAVNDDQSVTIGIPEGFQLILRRLNNPPENNNLANY